ncbi:hypothetical protein, partial [Streptomyces sp. NPDC005283]|uniref:hypothetical protein n=1 Tax=Streptomyces sp. NPDC005283 TaxID=3156871 RepID=UPI003453F764
NGKCKSNWKKPKCEKGTHWENGKCKSNWKKPKCEKGTHWENGKCKSNWKKPTKQKCQSGHWVDGHFICDGILAPRP